MPEVASSRPKLWRRRLIAIGLVFGIAGVIAVMNPGSRSTSRKLPDPNGYDDLVRAGALIQGDWPNKGDLAKADLGEVRPFVESNKAALDLARVGLGRECLAHLEKSQAGLTQHGEALGRIRNLSRLLIAEARIFEVDHRFGDAARTYRDLMELGQVITQGGMALDAAMGWMFQEQGVSRLRKVRDELSIEECRAILRNLESLDKRRVSVKELEDRWFNWYQDSFNPLERTMYRWSGVENTTRLQERGTSQKSRDKIQRSMRFFEVELAIHAFHLEKGTWPRSVEELVPAYLSSAPIDPGTGKTIDYPANPSGELTDDLNTIARPDGEVAPKP